MAKKKTAVVRARRDVLKERWVQFFSDPGGCMFNNHVNDAEARAMRLLEVISPMDAQEVKRAIFRNHGPMNMAYNTPALIRYEMLIVAFVLGA